MEKQITSIVVDNIAGICDSFVLGLACVATDNGFIEAAQASAACIRAIHATSGIVCPVAVSNDTSFRDYLIQNVERSLSMPPRQYLLEEFRCIDRRLDRHHLFALASLPRTSLGNAFMSTVRLALGVNSKHRYFDFVQAHVNERTIDKATVYASILSGLSEVNFPDRYKSGIADALEAARRA